MKRILHILFGLLWLVSCSDEGLQAPVVSETGAKVTYSIGMNIPEAQKADSRALGEWNMEADAPVLTLQLVVFDANGFFVEAVDADYQSHDNDKVNFKVALSATEEKRIIHFILNSPQASSGYTFGMEQEVIGLLATENQTPAYWQRLEFPNGTAKYTNKEGIITVEPHPDTIERMQEVPMIRNFAKISVENRATTTFTLESFAIINTWDKGTVAPYNQTGGTGSFTVFHTGKKGRTYAEINGEGYEGTTPTDAVLQNADPASVTFLEPGASFYMYERRNTYSSTNNTPTTFMLVKGTFGGKTCYYKIDLIYELANSGGQMQYYNILRNFHYHVIINGVSGYGYDTPAEAANHVASNNLNNSIDIRDFTNIAATENDRLFVSYTDTTLVDTRTVQVKYRYKEGGGNNDLVTIENLSTGSSHNFVVSATPEQTDTDGGWRIVNVAFNGEKMPTNEEVYTNTLRFVVYNTGTQIPYLSREVDFNLRKPMDMIVECVPSIVPTGVDQRVAANILIPYGITESHDPYQLFPLEFLVEAEELSLYPDVGRNDKNITYSPSELPVQTGPSIVPDVEENAFGYVRTVTIEEYNALLPQTVTMNGVKGTYKVIPCYFKTNKVASATRVYAHNKYFTLVREGYFNNISTTLSTTLSGEQYYGENRTVTLEFGNVDAGEDYKVVFTEGDEVKSEVTVQSAQSTGNRVTYTTTTWGQNIKAYIVYDDGIEYAVPSDVRNVLNVRITGGTNAPNNYTNITITLPNGSTLTKTWNELKAGTDITIDNLSESDTISFQYQWYWYTYNASATAGDLATGTTLDFRQ
ncbi:MAG: hypothetical protein IJZ38_06785 [Bacteroides sp.]|nr:hypothetical protein [Bacteroides sp.]